MKKSRLHIDLPTSRAQERGARSNERGARMQTRASEGEIRPVCTTGAIGGAQAGFGARVCSAKHARGGNANASERGRDTTSLHNRRYWRCSSGFWSASVQRKTCEGRECKRERARERYDQSAQQALLEVLKRVLGRECAAQNMRGEGNEK